jgi:hypothetical protein
MGRKREEGRSRYENPIKAMISVINNVLIILAVAMKIKNGGELGVSSLIYFIRFIVSFRITPIDLEV